MPRSLSPLRHREFRFLAAGQLASNIGDGFYAVALPWYVLADHGNPLLLGTVLAAYGIPRTVVVAVGGHASDRWHPWTVMMAADIVRAVAVAGLAGVAASGPAHASFLIPIAAVLGTGTGLFLPGSFAIVPSLLPDDDLQAGNALSFGGAQLAGLIGPAIGGAVVAGFGPETAFVVDAATFVLSAVTLAQIRRKPERRELEPGSSVTAPEPGVDTSIAHEAPQLTLRRLIATEPLLRVILIATFAANIGFGGMSEVALPALARGPFHAGAAGYGGLVAAFGAGALLGTLIAAQVPTVRRPGLVGSMAYLVEAGACAVVPYLGGTLPGGAALLVFGALEGFTNIVIITAFQRWTPPKLRGRVMGILMLAAVGTFPVSVLLAGLVVHDLGAREFFPLNAALLGATIIWTLTQRSWREFGTPDASTPAIPRPRALGNDGRGSR